MKSAPLKPSEFSRFVAAEVRGHGGRIAEDAADLLVQAVGQDLRALAGGRPPAGQRLPGRAADGGGRAASTSAAAPR